MKKIIVFIILFSIGIGVLWWLEQKAGADSNSTEIPVMQAPSTPISKPTIEEATEDTTIEADQEESKQGIFVNGSMEVFSFYKKTGLLKMLLVSASSETERIEELTMEDRFGDVKIDLYDFVDSQAEIEKKKLGVIEAKQARIRRIQESLESVTRPKSENVIHLEMMSAEIAGGQDLTNLQFQSPSGIVDLRAEKQTVFSMQERIAIQSKELTANGLGAKITILNQLDSSSEAKDDQFQFIEIEQDAELEFLHTPVLEKETEDAKRERKSTLVKITSQGPLLLNSIDLQETKSRSFEASDKVSMTLSGGQSSQLRAEHLEGRIHIAEAGEELLLDKVLAHGKVRWNYETHVFQSDTLELNSDAQGELTEAELTGFSSILLNIQFDPSKLSHIEPVDPNFTDQKIGPSQVFIKSPSRIEMKRLGDRFQLLIAGPATIESQGFSLRSGDDLKLSFPRSTNGEPSQSGLVKTEASGGVELELLEYLGQPYSKLETVALDLELNYIDKDTTPNLEVRTQGGAKFAGSLEDGRAFTLDTPSQLHITQIDAELTVKEAFNIVINIDAVPGAPQDSAQAESLLAVCKHLVEFNTATEKLIAIDGVSLSNALGKFSADKIETSGSHFIEVWGSEEEQVILNSGFGRVDADYIKVADGFYLMRDNITASLVGFPKKNQALQDLKLARFDIHCDELELQQLESRLDLIIKCKATGKVSCELAGLQRSFNLHHADELNLQRTRSFSSPEKKGSVLASGLYVDIKGSVDAHVGLDRSSFELRSNRVQVDMREELLQVTRKEITATGQVRFNGRWNRTSEESGGVIGDTPKALRYIDAIAFDGKGQELIILADDTAQLVGTPKHRVLLNGVLPLQDNGFRLTAERVQFGPDSIDAVEPIINLVPGDFQIGADRLVANTSTIDLTGRTTITGMTNKGVPWTLSADHVDLFDPKRNKKNSELASDPGLFAVLNATGNVHFSLKDKMDAYGDVLTRNALGIKLRGDPCSVIAHRPNGPSTIIKSKWIKYDPDLEVVTEMGAGELNATKGGHGSQAGQDHQAQDWKLKFESFKTEFDQDSILFFLSNPFFEKTSGGEKISLRSSYAIIWVARDKWENFNNLKDELGSTTKAAGGKGRKRSGGSLDIIFQFLDSQSYSKIIHEVYFEGPVETFRDDKLVSHADAVYLDLKTGCGWLTGVTLNISGDILGRDSKKLVLKADWLRHLSDGSLQADHATITPCDHEIPHLQVVTSELNLTPKRDDDDPGYQITAKNNGIEFYNLFTLPLPPLDIKTDADLKPQWPSFNFGNSTRFGQVFGLKFSVPAPNIGRFIHNILSSDSTESATPDQDPGGSGAIKKKPKDQYKSNLDIDVSYLSSRGALFDLGFSMSDKKDRYWLKWINGVVFDSGRDRGFIRTPDEDRGNIRLWLRSQGRIQLKKSSIGFSYSDQSDPAVQSEFFESNFTRYEQDQTYLQWKRHSDNYWQQASVQVRVDQNQAALEELPSLTAFKGRAPLFDLGSINFIHSGQIRADYLRRLTPKLFDLDDDGSRQETLTSPFASDGNYSDGLGEQDVLRVDTTQTLEASYALGYSGLRLTPFANFYGTYWNNSIDDDNAARVIGDVGARLSSVFWKRAGDESLHQFSPYIEYRNDLVSKQDGNPLDLDATERALFGNFIQVASRSRFNVKEDQSLFDLDVKGTYATGRSDGGADGWLPLEVYSRLGINPNGRRFDIWYDGRFDVNNGESIYSHFSLGSRVRDNYGGQIGYTYGRDSALVKVFDRITLSGFVRWTDKWEFEARQSISLLEDQQLGFELVLRRYGHDVIFELESKLREGEGSAIGFSLVPRIGFRPNRIGYTKW